MANPENKIERVGIWIRLSTENQFQGDTPEVHEARAEHYAQSKGWLIVERYRCCFSGKAVMEHPETQRMLHDVESGRIQGLIFSKLARLGRNIEELIKFGRFFEEHNAHLISLAESLDTSTHTGRLLFHILASLAEWEREEISTRIIASVETRADMGKPLGGVAPFGYIWQGNKPDKKLIVNADEAVIVQEAFNTYVKCRKIKTTARILNEKGYRTRKGVLWSDTSVGRMLQDTTYKGTHYLNHTKSTGDGKSWVLKPKEKWRPLAVESIASVELWDQVAAIIKMNATRYTRRQNVYLLTGLLHCGNCGGKMYGYDYDRSKGYYKCQKCPEKIGIAEIESVLVDELKNYKFSPKQLIGLPEDTEATLETKLAKLHSESKRIQREIDELLGLYHKHIINESTLAERVHKMEEQQMQITQEIPKVEEELMTKKLKKQRNEISTHIKSIGAIFNSLSFQAKRAIVEDLLESITVNRHNIEINFYLLNYFKKNLVEVRKYNKPSWIHGCGEHEARWIG